MSINEIKAQIVCAGIAIQGVVGHHSTDCDWSDNESSLSTRLQRESARYKEVLEFAAVLECDIVWQKRREP